MSAPWPATQLSYVQLQQSSSLCWEPTLYAKGAQVQLQNCNPTQGLQTLASISPNPNSFVFYVAAGSTTLCLQVNAETSVIELQPCQNGNPLQVFAKSLNGAYKNGDKCFGSSVLPSMASVNVKTVTSVPCSDPSVIVTAAPIAPAWTIMPHQVITGIGMASSPNGTTVGCIDGSRVNINLQRS
jgi:hypothetical protein